MKPSSRQVRWPNCAHESGTRVSPCPSDVAAAPHSPALPGTDPKRCPMSSKEGYSCLFGPGCPPPGQALLWWMLHGDPHPFLPRRKTPPCLSVASLHGYAINSLILVSEWVLSPLTKAANSFQHMGNWALAGDATENDRSAFWTRLNYCGKSRFIWEN